ncbi:MAG: DegQ family serine endoprotease [Burkholderiales bacterium]
MILSKKLLTLAVAAALTGGAAGVYLSTHDVGAFAAHAAGLPSGPPTSTPAPALTALPDFSRLVDRYGPAVVNITVRLKHGTDGQDDDDAENESDAERFFRRFGQPPQPTPVPATAVGSGFIVRADGLVLTNAHVVDHASDVTIRLTDGREFLARVLGVDERSDVAVLKVDAKDLPTVTLGKDSATRVGEWVVAIGSPFGFDNSVTAGIVSAKGRALPDGTYVPFLQTDVAVNPGNSGGPLFNLKGEVIGINSQIYSRSGGYQGLSFAIPIDVASKVADEIEHHGKVVRGRIGVSGQDLTQALAESFGLPDAHGAVVSAVDPAGPAAHAGLRPGDVILHVNGRPVNRSIELAQQIGDLKPGSRATLDVWRDGTSRPVAIEVAELQEAHAANATDSSAQQGKLGVAVRALTPEERAEIATSSGVLVEGVTGAAARAGIRPGDVLLQFNGSPVSSVEDLRALVDHAGKKAALLVQRDNLRLFVPVTLG